MELSHSIEVAMPLPLLTLDPEFTLMSLSAAAESLFGVTSAETKGQDMDSLFTLFDGGDRRTLRNKLAAALSDGEVFTTDVMGKTARDGPLPIRVHLGGYTADGERRMFAVCEDRRETYRLEEEIKQYQKLSSLGRLTGGIAHDFNNLLTAILGHAELALSPGDVSEKTGKHLRQIVAAANRAAALTDQLLVFARKRQLERTPVMLDLVLEKMSDLLRRVIREDIEIVFDLNAPGVQVLADAAQLEQAVLNLTTNARDAMTTGGKISITTNTNENLVTLTVTDKGSGIDADTLSRVYEPFFTTKDQGKGTGLGLSLVKSVIEQFDGTIQIESQLGTGTTVTLTMPIEPHREVAAVEINSHLTICGCETVLVVEDNEDVLEVTVETLESLGYVVLATTSPLEAISIASKPSTALDILVTDVIMPQLNGLDLAKKICEGNPGLPVLYVSGYQGKIAEQSGLIKQGENLVHKPYTTLELGRAIRRLLEVRPVSPTN